MRLAIGALTAAVLIGGQGEAMAVVPAKVVTETMEFLVKRYGDDVLREGTETVAEQVTKVLATYGDEGLEAVRKVGPRGIKVIQEAGEDGLDVVKVINRYGDNAVWVISKPKGMAMFLRYGDDGVKALIKHKGIAEEIIETHGKLAVGVLNAIDTRGARQIAMLQKDGVIKAGEQGDQLLNVIIKYGDKAMSFIWRNKGALGVTAVLGTFIANPEAYIEGGKELIVEGVSRPVTEMGKEVARNTDWTLLGSTGIAMLGILAIWRTLLRRPAAIAGSRGRGHDP
jgi:hypothetical protein